jgi:protein BUR2
MDPTSQPSSAPQLPAARERPRPPPPTVAEAEKQWLFTEEELGRSPSIVDGMSPEEEKTLRKKGVNFILQVGIMLKLPQTTLGTAAVFFNRFLMRYSLKPREGHRPLHHYVSLRRPIVATELIRVIANWSNGLVSCYQGRRKLPQNEGIRHLLRARRP